MHFVPPERTITSGLGPILSSAVPPDQVHVLFSEQQQQQQHPLGHRKLGDIIAEKTAQQEFFYGLELTGRSFGHETVLDYNSFGSMLPLFTSLVWLGQNYWNITPISEVETIRLAHQLRVQTLVLPHFSCYRADRQRLTDFLALNYANMLAVRGDAVESEQEFKHAYELVSEVRRIRGDTISIGVAGHPEGHPDAKSMEDDMKFLIEKVNAGADFIITQMSFSADAIINFIRNCRSRGITVPIMVGVYVPERFRTMERMLEITRVPMPAEDFSKFKQLSENTTEFGDYAVHRTVEMLMKVFDSNLGVYGLQFFTMNRFKGVHRVLQELKLKKIFGKNKIS